MSLLICIETIPVGTYIGKAKDNKLYLAKHLNFDIRYNPATKVCLLRISGDNFPIDNYRR